MNCVGFTRHPAVSRLLLGIPLTLAALWIAACGGGSDSLTPIQVGAVAVEPGSTQLASIGDTARLTVKVTDTNGQPISITNVTVTWTSSNPSVATVSSAGLVTAVSNGNATITASADGISGDATVAVNQVMASLSVTPPAGTMVSFGETLQLTATPLDAKAHPMAPQAATWTSSDNGIAAISAAGLVTAVKNGTVTLTATIGTFTATASVTVAQAVASVAVTPNASTLASLGETVQLTAAPMDANGNPVAGQTVTWSSSNAAVALVGPTGLVTAMATGGPVTITASAGGKSGTAAIVVTQAVVSVQVTPGAGTLVSLGETLQLAAAALDANNATINGVNITWVSSNAAVATVSSTGLVTAVANGGPVTITASVGGKSGTSSVTVTQVVTSVGVTPGTGTLVSLGETLQLIAAPVDARGNPVTGQVVTWSSSNTGVASVSTNGLVTAIANGGPVTVTATSGTKSGTAAVTVAQAVASVSVTPPGATLTSLGSSIQLTATPKDANGNAVAGQTVTWTSSDATVALVGATGLVTAMASGGPVTVTASAGGKSGTASVTVTQAVASVAITPPATTISALGATAQLTGTALDANNMTIPGVTVVWSSSNVSVATVSSTGLVTAVANGGPITITGTVGTKSGTAAVSVAQVVSAVAVTPAATTLNSFGASVQLTAAPTDANGNPVPGQTAQWTSSDVTNSVLTVSSTGLVTAVGNGSATLTGTIGGKSGTATVTVQQIPATLTITTQPSATIQNGVTFPTVPVVTVKDAQGNGVGNQSVAVSVATGGVLTFTNGMATTNASGVATFSGLSATGLVGARTLQFTTGTVVSPASSAVTLAAGAPASVTITTQPAPAVQSGIAFPTVPVVQVKDGSGNLVSGQAVTVSVGSGSALTFTGGTATTDGSGSATFLGLTATGLAGDRTLLFTAGAAVSAASNTVTLSAGAPATVAITTQPSSSVRSGVLFAAVPVVTVTDGGGNPVAGQAVTVSVSTGAALTFTNATATTDGTGVATFTGLTASGLIGARTLKFTAGTAVSPNSAQVTVTAGLPGIVTITTQPAATVQTGVAFSTVPVVTVTDSATNVVASQAVTVSVASGNALTFAPASVNTNSSGVATFTGLVATGGVGVRTLQFTAGAAVSVPSQPVAVNGGPPASVTITTQPATSVQSGVAFPTVPVVTVKDAQANAVANQAVTVTVATGAALSFTNGTATTDANGVATFTGLSASGLIGARTLRFTAGTANATSGTVTVTAGLPAAVAITTQPSPSVTVGVAFAVQPAVTVTDAATNVVPSQVVTISVGSGSPLTFTNGTATTSASGVATFSGLAVTGVAGARTFLFTAGTAVSAPSATVTVAASSNVGKIIVSPATTMLISTANTKQLTVVAQDSGGNPVNPQPAITSYTFTTANSSIATVSTTGLVTGGATSGTVTITAAIGSVNGTTIVMNGQVAVVTNNADRTVSILNGRTVQATLSVGNGPLDVAITPDGATAWVNNNNGSTIQLVTLGTNVVSAPLASSNPRGISIAPAGDFAFIVLGALSPSMDVYQVSTATNVGNRITGTAPRYVVATSTDVWITDSTRGGSVTNGQIMRYNRSVGLVTDSITVGANPYGIDFSSTTPGGPRLYVTNRDSNSVTVINATTLARIATIPVGSQPRGVKITPDGTRVYVANQGGNTVSVINTTSNTVTNTITVGSNPAGLAITAAGDLVYVANSGSGTVSTIANTATPAVTGTAITVGGTPMHIALRKVQ